MRTENRTTALAKTNGCPGCTGRQDLPSQHLCNLQPEGKLRTIPSAASQALTTILPFLTTSIIPLIQGEITLQRQLQPISAKKRAA
jgi:hypothetical protein